MRIEEYIEEAIYGVRIQLDRTGIRISPGGNRMTEWSGIFFLTAGFVLSLVAALIGAAIQRILNRRGEMRPLNQLLNFGNDDLLFVFPHREEIYEAILPRTSTEDFLAMNNVISALIKIGWRRKIAVRDTTRLSPADKKRNLVSSH
jgi:hypothetical protein